MSEIYKLPGSSYEELIKIIRAYAATSKNGAAVSLAEVAQSTGMNRTIISRNNGFLTQIKLVSEGNKKTGYCGRKHFLVFNPTSDIRFLWAPHLLRGRRSPFLLGHKSADLLSDVSMQYRLL